jgi:hypothetical protein
MMNVNQWMDKNASRRVHGVRYVCSPYVGDDVLDEISGGANFIHEYYFSQLKCFCIWAEEPFGSTMKMFESEWLMMRELERVLRTLGEID